MPDSLARRRLGWLWSLPRLRLLGKLRPIRSTTADPLPYSPHLRRDMGMPPDRPARVKTHFPGFRAACG